MKTPNEEIILKVKPRPSETITISIPKDTLESLRQVADIKDMSLEALLKLYIGQGLRQELAKNFLETDTVKKVETIEQ